MTFLRRVLFASMVATATAAFGCTSLLGDFTVGDTAGSDASTTDGSSGDAPVTGEGGGGDGTTTNDGSPSEGGLAHLVIDKMMKDFGTHPLASAVPAETFTITNNGTGMTGTLTVTINGSAFTRAGGTCMAGTSLATGATCTVDIAIDTSRIGMSSGTLVVADGASDMVSASLAGNIVMSCPANMPTLCNGTCVDTVTDPLNCMTCGRRCAGVPNATPGCASSMCGVGMCNGGFRDCNNMASDGCESNIANDVANCGGCNRQCALPGATPTCVNSTCAIASCNGGFRDCDGVASTGCEIDTSSDIAHCGGCLTPCNLANAVPACSSGMCKVSSCNSPFKDCNLSPADGCESNSGTDDANCGGCGTQCMGGKHCVGANCTCTGGTPDLCGGNCTNMQTDPANCGACGHSCLMGACTAGVCQPIVLHAADGARGSGITVDFTDVYWTSGMGAAGSVFKCPINGACVTPTTVKSALNFPYSIVKAPGFANLLFGALVGNTVYDLNASTNALIASLAGQTQTQGIAVSNSNVYWGTSNFVMRGDFVFNSATQMITGTSQVTALTFDATTGNIFATDQGPPGRVISCSGVNPCGNAPLLLATNQPSPGGITITSNRVYWTDYGTGPSYADGGVFSCATGGGAQTTVATGNAYGAATGITSDASSIYWASINSGGIYAYSISSGSVRTLATGQGTTYAITNDAVAVYWVRADGALVKVAK